MKAREWRVYSEAMNLMVHLMNFQARESESLVFLFFRKITEWAAAFLVLSFFWFAIQVVLYRIGLDPIILY
jgi:hypothetical protein